MTVNKFFKNISVGVAALTLVLTLAGCGSQSTTSSQKSSSTSRSTQSSENDSTKAVRSANRSIRNNDFQEAYDNLNSTNNRSNEAENLKGDLQNYLTAKRAYNNGDYQTASNSLKPLKSTSTAMRDAYASLQSKINKKQATKTSTSSSSQRVANQQASDKTSDRVVEAFANKMGFTGEKGYSIIPTSASGNIYKLEVRQNNSDNTVSNMVGIYQYNSQTGAVTKLQ
ncbi:hypothetical protein [Limosilactobacillus agrestimuris]|uniref:hypothetical protein n=1 Tax=Limosilactobacillus agrestimuris TaxID=2941331 RepID=UPI00203AC64D|nr:hypothetical protein [Limosilactobacillus agrestimuris]